MYMSILNTVNYEELANSINPHDDDEDNATKLSKLLQKKLLQ